MRIVEIQQCVLYNKVGVQSTTRITQAAGLLQLVNPMGNYMRIPVTQECRINSVPHYCYQRSNIPASPICVALSTCPLNTRSVLEVKLPTPLFCNRDLIPTEKMQQLILCQSSPQLSLSSREPHPIPVEVPASNDRTCYPNPMNDQHQS